MTARKLGGLAIAACAALTALFPSAASAQALTLKERIVLGSFNMCWEGEEGKNLTSILRENGFVPAPQATNNIHFRQEGDTTLFFNYYFGDDQRGGVEHLCRITAVKPQLVTPWTPKGPVLPAFDQLLDRVIGGAANMSGGYRPTELRQPIAGRPGHRRSLLRLDQGQRARIIYVEEGPTYYEFVYHHGQRSIVNDPASLSSIVEPSSRAAMQLFVDDGWEIAFCNLNPHQCLTKEQQRQRDIAAAQARENRSSGNIPFSGIGSTRSGDNRSQQQRSNDKAWWENYHRCGSGKC